MSEDGNVKFGPFTEERIRRRKAFSNGEMAKRIELPLWRELVRVRFESKRPMAEVVAVKDKAAAAALMNSAAT